MTFLPSATLPGRTFRERICIKRLCVSEDDSLRNAFLFGNMLGEDYRQLAGPGVQVCVKERALQYRASRDLFFRLIVSSREVNEIQSVG